MVEMESSEHLATNTQNLNSLTGSAAKYLSLVWRWWTSEYGHYRLTLGHLTYPAYRGTLGAWYRIPSGEGLGAGSQRRTGPISRGRHCSVTSQGGCVIWTLQLPV